MMRAAAGRQEDAPARRQQATLRTKPVRLTVDMTPELHRKLKRWAADAADEIEAADVPLAEVVRALVRRLAEDDQLAAQVLEDLRSLR